MKLYAQWNDDGQNRDIGEITQLDNKAETLFIRINVLLHPRDIENIRKDIEEKTGKKCVVVDRRVELDHVE